MGAPLEATGQVSVAPLLGRSVRTLPRVGSKGAERLANLGIVTVRDLLFHWPRTWHDFTTLTPVSALRAETTVCVQGRLSELVVTPRLGRRKARVSATLTDTHGDSVAVVWFNQTYLARVLPVGEPLLLRGPVLSDWSTRQLTLTNPVRALRPELVPIYPETAGLTSRFLAALIQPLLAQLTLPDPIGTTQPESGSLRAAIQTVHRPASLTDALKARRRLELDELVALQVAIQERRRERTGRHAPAIVPAVPLLQRTVQALPFQLTDGQRRAIWQIAQILNQASVTETLLQGDVGTGKTVVAALAALSVLEAGWAVRWMVPTQLLAQQLAERVRSLLAPTSFSVALITGGTKDELPQHGPGLAIGTQALLTAPSSVPVGLVIVDEQHRFGVAQREALAQGKEAAGPHILTMTATPIPRSLALTIFGDGAVVTLTERPTHQQPTTTTLVDSWQDQRCQAALTAALAAGQQVFVVVPRIEQAAGGSLFAQTLAERAQAYRQQFPAAQVAVCHGQLDSVEQEERLRAFAGGDVDVLVATTIIEVGVDVPNATTMIIEDAEQFGLAQLHQLRGRIGRGAVAGQCFLIPSPAALPEARERLKAVAETADGFALAELDLATRGPGHLTGTAQSGLPELKLARLSDAALVAQARELAGALLVHPPRGLAAWRALYQRAEEEVPE
ncbi:ATP-dependent DNA helicase RecG [Candidatus Berkelbacteria bacterium]|nr:ATP-dependent DNA helicase RecG [Candidatus Berkelbacteria bacterium]